ncbi:hypothetical protein BDP27DRAFT_1339781 [Rhodocollybia butyracea]|uniref:Uncharacterized protein n=1 Tax=Rhodocollybia butyracea TaxID=206335 RepID=A0A9P5TZJ6_9AGAR|nr:hypothetical protein BDP27DRAFT_1339781 [Rhodocollybia butyracea]
MSEANVLPHSLLYSRSSTSLESPMYSSLETAYQALHTEFLAKSRHNDIPDSPVARTRLCALIARTRSDMGACSESTTRSEISRVLELQESLLAPIRTLPSDVLIDIFQLVIETSNKPGITYSWPFLKPTFHLSGCIFLFTWICFWWRDQAVSYSTFWSRIKVNCGFQVALSTELTVFLNECILRSGVSVPMSIEIFTPLPKYQSPPAVVTMLVARAHRWRQAALSFTYLHDIDIIFPFKLSSAHFPLLKDLSFQWDEYWIDPVLNPILECRPPLQKLKLSKLSESYTDVIASRNLKVLELDRYSGVSLARLLCMCPCLESLTLRSFRFGGNPDAKQIPCQSSLSNLTIGGHMDYHYIDNGVWDCVTLPKLARLHATLVDLVDYDQWEGASAAATPLGKLKECALEYVKLETLVEDYEENNGAWPESVLEIVEYFFKDLSVKAEGRFVGNIALQDWKDYASKQVPLYRYH